MMYQVRMRQNNAEITGWIEERGARKGAMVEVRILDGLWEVVEVFQTGMEDRELRQKQARDRNCFGSIA